VYAHHINLEGYSAQMDRREITIKSYHQEENITCKMDERVVF